mgnify:FL=1|tara:strand:+ start:784 stop:1626 length:843 start_codon:yes stop_codon:yes gene_type:complete
MTDETRLYMQLLEEECIINTTDIVEYPPVAISMGETTITSLKGTKTLPIPIGTYGNFSFVQAPPKTMKTFFISLLASVYLGGSNKFGGDLKGHRDNKCLIHFDTEQGKFHAQRVFRRVVDMNGGNDVGCYHTFGLRTVGFKHRIEFIEYYLKEKIEKDKVGLVVIDGIADLVSDVNDLEQSNNVVQKIMEWSQKFSCHIITVIHSNFGSDKPTGHLGSLLEKKTETQIQLETNTVNKDWITVKCKRSRGYAFDTFSFKVNNVGLPEIIGNLYNPLDGVSF